MREDLSLMRSMYGEMGVCQRARRASRADCDRLLRRGAVWAEDSMKDDSGGSDGGQQAAEGTRIVAMNTLIRYVSMSKLRDADASASAHVIASKMYQCWWRVSTHSPQWRISRAGEHRPTKSPDRLQTAPSREQLSLRLSTMHGRLVWHLLPPPGRAASVTAPTLAEGHMSCAAASFRQSLKEKARQAVSHGSG